MTLTALALDTTLTQLESTGDKETLRTLLAHLTPQFDTERTAAHAYALLFQSFFKPFPITSLVCLARCYIHEAQKTPKHPLFKETSSPPRWTDITGHHPDSPITIIFGGGLQYIRSFTKGRAIGYPDNHKRDRGIYVHPLFKGGLDEDEIHDRSQFYATQACKTKGLFDTPAELTATITAKELLAADRRYEAFLPTSRALSLTNITIRELPSDPSLKEPPLREKSAVALFQSQLEAVGPMMEIDCMEDVAALLPLHTSQCLEHSVGREGVETVAEL